MTHALAQVVIQLRAQPSQHIPRFNLTHSSDESSYLSDGEFIGDDFKSLDRIDP